ncbi:T9SS type A sorting domain-containing protein [Flavobacterium frigoris]|uniref:Por secretion system C-terminal sorting domain-containing protein n=1 Tax=Flavobacterium frigoris TaxID=229204 RepID=A0A1H9BYA3_FLAFI|nr:T9SS type A sorting domain-containing protein [Flavobacterium frigoris]SEP93368.1 Por secretion system C-terminal sorting domain-containing protein [Flavobacterium frigoris]
MKITLPLSIPKLFFITCLFSLCIVYGQEKKHPENIIFGKQIKAESVNPKNGYIRCVTTEYEKFLKKNNPKRMTTSEFEAWVNPLVNQYKTMKNISKPGGVITIPVVVHVIHSGQPIGVAPNITDAQVQSQIKVLNQDFRKMLGTPGGTNPAAADIEIEFVLALQASDGNPTNGIDRIDLCEDAWSTTDIDLKVKPNTIWDPTLYMNMWSVDISGNSILGYAQFPDASGLDGLGSSGGDANTDGVVSRYDVFGSLEDNDGTFLLTAPYNKGRTMTHEVGHWLGLRHIWGDGNGDEEANTPDCLATDYCADTPQAGWEHYTCGVFDTCPSSPGIDMPENYMDYTEDACMNIFTQNQKERMVTIINNAARRKTLISSTKNLPIELVANDAEVTLEPSCTKSFCNALTNQTTQRVTIYNRGTNNLLSATINYNINKENNLVYNWTGNLATNKYTTFDITLNSTSQGIINVSIAGANSTVDQRSTNNNASGTFFIPTIPSSYSFTNYVFTLQPDNFGSETSWDLKDASGNIVYQSDTYPDADPSLGDLITIPWKLKNNECYTFTINDSYDDGICCGGGNGYYNIKLEDGVTIVASGDSFTTAEKKYFKTTSSLGIADFETSTDIYLYPNPTKETLNILVPNDFGLPTSYIIYNSLGQTISKKKVSRETDLSINTSALSNGIYFVTVVKESAKQTLKFIKK